MPYYYLWSYGKETTVRRIRGGGTSYGLCAVPYYINGNYRDSGNRERYNRKQTLKERKTGHDRH